MEISIRNYDRNDYEAIRGWWEKRNEIAPFPSMLPEESTFMVSINNQPALCITVYLTNCKDFALLENYIGNPDLSGPGRRAATKKVLEFVEGFAGALGYRRLLANVLSERLEAYYADLGLKMTRKCTQMAKEISNG